MPEQEFDFKPFHCRTEQRGEAAYVRPYGELDLLTVPDLDEQLRAALDGGSRRVVLDLRGLSFMDSTGISLVTRWNLESERDGFQFALIQGDERVRRLFELTALTDYFVFVDG